VSDAAPHPKPLPALAGRGNPTALPSSRIGEEGSGEGSSRGEELVLELDGYEGPIDLLLTLAREQKVDLGKISILALADQYLAFISRQRSLRLEIAADYLVMAAWLAYLKSRLLLPQPPEDDEPSGAELAAELEHRLRLLEAVQNAGRRLMARPQTGQDGFLRADDIYNMRLRADLVVLSACRTALGKEIRGEGLVGLTRAFMYAGAPRIIASLWRIPDSATAELMMRFYRGLLRDNLAPAAALRRAQLELANHPRYRDPYYWAGFVLEGEWR